jgi:hypothetical protein
MTSYLDRLRNDDTYTRDAAAIDIADAFSSVQGLAAARPHLTDTYSILRADPTLSRLVFDELIRRHNEAASNSSARFIAACCCCGLDEFQPAASLVDISAVERAAFLQKDTSILLTQLSAYREHMHNSANSPSLQNKRKDRAAIELYDRLISRVPISTEEADYLYATLQRNECIAKGLFDFAAAGAQFGAITDPDLQFPDNPIVSNLRSVFRGGDDGGGGGCCCCCCCCCCGGGC